MRVTGSREIPFKASCISCKQDCYVMQSELAGLGMFEQVEVICNRCSWEPEEEEEI